MPRQARLDIRSLAIGLCLLLVTLCGNAGGCDFDNDGIDDLTTYEQQGDGSWTWRYVKSSDSSTVTTSNFGASGSYPSAGYYFGSGQPAQLGHVESTSFYWNVLAPDTSIDRLNFGLDQVSYYPGHDLNGDGVDDLSKFLQRCNKITQSCYKKSVRGNFALNGTDGTDTFKDITTATLLLGKGLSPLVAIDADGNGTEEVCYALPNKSNRRNFTFTCKQPLTDTIVAKRSVGKIFNAPLQLKRAGTADLILLWKRSGTRTVTTSIGAGNQKTTATIEAVGKVLTGDWLGTGSQQIGIATNAGSIVIYNPLDLSTTSRTLPSGTAIDCDNNLSGPGESKILTSANVCKIFDC